MYDVNVERFSKDNLVRQDWNFKFYYDRLIYTSYYEFHRDSVNELWGDEWEAPINYHVFLENEDLDDTEYAWNKYSEYKDSMNPVCFYALDGKPKMSGIFGAIKHMEPCPDDVAEEALAKFRALPMKVIYK